MRVANVLAAAFLICLLSLAVVYGEISVAITSPQDGAILTPCADHEFTFDVQTTAGETVKDVKLYSNGVLKGRIIKVPWTYQWRNMVGGRYTVYAVLTTTDGLTAQSAPMIIRAGSVSSGEKVMNGSFDCGLTPWSMNINSTDGAAANGQVINDFYFDDDSYLFVEITNRGSQNWHVQLQQNIPVDSGHVYQLSFMADADDQKPVLITMQENQDPWTVQWSLDMMIDGVAEYGPYEFIAVRTDPTNYIRFCLSGDTIPVYLDAIRLVDTSASSVKTREWDFGGIAQEYELLGAYPNPFNMNTTIPFTLSHNANVELAIYNMRGQLVKTLLNGRQEAGSHHVAWDGTDSRTNVQSSGIYFYTLTVESQKGSPMNMSRKVVLVK